MSSPRSGSSALRALGHRNFRLYWTGQLISLVGTWMQSVAQGWLLYRLRASPFLLGVLGTAQFLPILLFSLWAGVLADRVERRRLLLITQTLAMLQAALLAFLTSTGAISAWMVLALAFLYGTINAVDLPSRQSFLVELVEREDLPNAIALNSSAFNLARIVGPAIAGILVVGLGEAGCFWLNALSFLAVLYSLLRIRVPVANPPAGEPALQHLLAGARYVWSTRPIRSLLLLLGVMSGFGFQYSVLLPVYARDILHRDASGYGLLMSAFGVGSLISAAWLTRRLNRWGLRRGLLFGLAAASAGMATFALSRSLWLSMLGGALAGFGLILYVASTNTLLQLTTEDRFRGRVMSFYTLMFVGTAPFGALLAGAIAEHAGAPWATGLSALVLLAGAVWVGQRLRLLAQREAAAPVVVAPADVE